MKIDYSGQTALLTGATRGIGKQIALDLEKCGAKLILTGTSSSDIKKLNINAGPNREYYCVDFTSQKSTQNFLDEIKKIKKIDALIHNAGLNRINTIKKIKVADWDDIHNVNLKAALLLFKAVTPKMEKNQYGRIVSIASIFASISRAQRASYSSSKFGLKGLTIAASNELARNNILLNTVSPGFILTDMTKQNLSSAERKKLSLQVPIQRLGKPQDISSIVLYLASSLNTYLTGQDIVVDGGFTNI